MLGGGGQGTKEPEVVWSESMSIFRRKKTEKRSVIYTTGGMFDQMCCSGYTPLSKIPEVVSCARRIAQMLASATIYLMNNTEDGDERIVNELSRTIDINPMPNMTRSTWMEAIVMTMLLYGKGNAIVVPHTYQGYIQSLEPISASRVSFLPEGYRDYKVLIDGKPKKPGDVLHFVDNPDPLYLWQGRGVTAALKDVLDNIVQGHKTEKAFMTSDYKPSLVVRVDALAEEFSDPAGREALIESYVKPAQAGEPWIIPAEEFDIQQVKPLSLADLAINDSMAINKRMVAALFGCPPYMVGVGEYKKDEYNNFIQTTIMAKAKAIGAELTKKLILSPNWYLTLNVWSLMDYDLKSVSDVLLAGSDRGFVNGDEWRDRIHMSPAGLKEYRVLENYIPWDMSGAQKKLIQEGE